MTIDPKERAQAVELLLSAGRDDAPPPGSLEREAVRLGVLPAGAVAGNSARDRFAEAGARSAKVALSLKLATVVGIGLAVAGALGSATESRRPGSLSSRPDTAPSLEAAAEQVEKPSSAVIHAQPEAQPPETVLAAPAPLSEHRALRRPGAPEEVASAPNRDEHRPVIGAVVTTGLKPAHVPSAAAPSPSTSAAARSSSAALSDELVRLGQARTLAGKNPGQALNMLDSHARDYPASQFHEESTVIRVEALLAAGRRAEAEALAKPLLHARSDAPIARRLHDLLAED